MVTTLQLTTAIVITLLLIPVFGLRKFQGQGERHLSVLNHVVEAEVFDQVLCGVDVVVAVIEGAFNDESAGVATFGCRGVVGAGIATLRLDVRNVAVLSDDLGEMLDQ